MSQQFCYRSTPNVEEETFRWMVLYDYKISQAEWNSTEAEVTAAVAAAEVAVASLETAVDRLNKMFLQLRCSMMELGV